MDQQVSVILKSGERYTIHLLAADMDAVEAKEARFQIGEMFAASGLETPNPVGKILLIDQILLLANEQKKAGWAQPDADLKKFLAAVVHALGRPSVTIDLLNYKI